jgi:hypothetical protein
MRQNYGFRFSALPDLFRAGLADYRSKEVWHDQADNGRYLQAEFGYTLAEARRGFTIHAAVFGVVMTGLITLNGLLIAFTDANFPWAVFPLVCWGLGLVGHYFCGFRGAEREIRKRQAKIEEYATRPRAHA